MRPRQTACALAAGALLAACATSGQPADPALAARIAQLEAKADAAEGVRAIKRLQHAYGHYLSAGQWDDLGDLFTDDAVGEWGSLTVTGRDDLRHRFMTEAGRNAPGLDQGQLHEHLQLQPIVTLGPDGTAAKATWHELAMLGRFGESASWRGGVYENEYGREDGVWKISRIRYFEQYRGDYEDFGHTAPPAWNVPYHFEADHVGVTIPAAALEPRASTSRLAAGRRAARLAARGERMSDETAVANLQSAYGYYLDRKMWDDVADLFTDDGSFEAANGGAYVGRERIRAALEALYGPAPLQTGELFDHIVLQTVVSIEPDGRRATARSSQIAQLGRNGEWARWELGTYENSFVEEGGVWKIEEVRYFPRMTTDYDLGWAVDAQPAPGPRADLPPDRPSTGGHAAYPDGAPAAIGFASPTTRVPERTRSSLAVSDAALDAIERELDSAIAVDAVENLMSSYGYYIDESDWDAMADTFSETQGAKEITGAGTYVGRERIRTILNLRGPRGGRTPGFFTIHQLTQPVIHISEDGRYANARLRLFQSGGDADGSSGSWIGGIYENTAVFEDGEWKLGRQDLTHTFNAPYRAGWARVGPFRPAPTSAAAGGGGIRQGLGGARSAASFAADFPPDGPIRARQYAFPEIVEPAFHYRNPVSGREPPELLE